MRSSTSGSRPHQELIKFSQRTGMLTSEYEESKMLYPIICFTTWTWSVTAILKALSTTLDDRRSGQTQQYWNFTTLGLRISYLSSLYLACAIPILEDESKSGKRSPTLLHLSIRHVIELLSDAAIEIKSICDVSLVHVEELRKRSRHPMAKKGDAKGRGTVDLGSSFT